MSDSDQKEDDEKFNDTLKRMLKTPPKPHDGGKGEKNQDEKKAPTDTRESEGET